MSCNIIDKMKINESWIKVKAICAIFFILFQTPIFIIILQVAETFTKNQM